MKIRADSRIAALIFGDKRTEAAELLNRPESFASPEADTALRETVNEVADRRDRVSRSNDTLTPCETT